MGGRILTNAIDLGSRLRSASKGAGGGAGFATSGTYRVKRDDHTGSSAPWY